MSTEEPRQARNSPQTRETLKTIYFVVTGLSIVKALEVISSGFLSSPFNVKAIAITLLLGASFLITIVRFCQGVSRVLEDNRDYLISDFYGFFLHAIFFYFMACNINNSQLFAISFTFMLAVDSLWLIYIFWITKFTFNKVERQWIHSNLVLIIIFITFIISSSKKVNFCVSMICSITIFIASIIASIFDWRSNKPYYLGEPSEKRKPWLERPYFKNLFKFIFLGK